MRDKVNKTSKILAFGLAWMLILLLLLGTTVRGQGEQGDEHAEDGQPDDAGEQGDEHAENGQPNNTGQPDDTGQPDETGPPEDAQKRREEALQMAEQRGMFGRYTYENGSATGAFVEFWLNEDTGEITSYTVKKGVNVIVVFESITLERFVSANNSPNINGSVLMYEGTDVLIRAHNNPSAVLMHKALGERLTITYVLADGISAEKTDKIVSLIADNFQGWLILAGEGSITLNERNVTFELDTDKQVLFRAMPGATQGFVGSENQAAITEAIARGKMGAELSVLAQNGTIVEELIEYDEVEMRTLSVRNGTTEVEVSAELEEGRVVIINIDMETLNVSGIDGLVIKYDNVTIEAADSLDELLNATTAVYYITIGLHGVQVFVSIPEFSTHTITIQALGIYERLKEKLLKGDILVYTVTCIITTLIIVASVYVRRRKR